MGDLISVVVPVYNVAEDLPRCLDSILAQTYPEIEIIAVDDGSPDESGSILEQYASEYPNVHVFHQENCGVTAARLKGVRAAQGAWIGFVDGDDEIEPEMYARLIKNAQEHHADISHCGYQMVFEDGRVNYFHNTGMLIVHDRITALQELLSGEIVEPGLCNKLFRSELFYGLDMDVDVKINEDLLMNFNLFYVSGGSVFEDWCPYHYRVRSSSASRTKLNENKIYDPIRVKRLIYNSAPVELSRDAHRAYISTCIDIYHTLITAGRGYREDIRRVRGVLHMEKDSFHLLGSKRAMMADMIVSVPVIYKPIYQLYNRFWKKNPYI